MPDPVNLTGEIAAGIDSSMLRGAPVAIAYVRDDLSPSLSFRGSAQVHSPTEVAVWARKPDSGLAAAISEHPQVSLIQFAGADGPGPVFLSLEGRARLAPEANAAVYAAMVEREQQTDPERKGVAVLIEVDRVLARTAAGILRQGRE